ncbi:MAG: NAD(P)/FAD-dependent oxidoreductase [Clostridia bacterium]|nr:NAD(P)/FAD-dependent oxidoreductase [Clostridia bacterium]
MYDVLIIGAGPAGISAGLYAKRAGANVLILYYGDSELEKAERIENYYGFADGISGKKLYDAGIQQAINIGIEVKKEEVLDLNKEENIFCVETENDRYCSKTVIIATGNKKLKPNIPGINEFEGRGVSYCAICDGFFFRNKNVVVIGEGNYACREAEELKNIVNSVTILTNGQAAKFELKDSENNQIKIDEKKIKEFTGNTKIEQIKFEDESTMQVDGVFIAIGEASGVDFAKKIGIALNGDSIIADKNMQTNIEGLYSAGNVSGGLYQICKATYEGAIAGMSAAKYVKE